MTAEIAILNRQGVALAADSAVTITHPGGHKIYNSVNKLFMLSKHAPVGVMIHGVADLTGIPWETLVKAFRRELGEQTFPHLNDYADALLQFVNAHKKMFSDEQQQLQLFSSVLLQYREILGRIDSRLSSLIAERQPVSETQIKRVVDQCIRDSLAVWTSASKLKGVPADYGRRLRRKWPKVIEAVVETVFGKLPIGATARERLREIAGLVFTADRFPDNVSGVVVAGFGEDEFFPCLVSYDVEGVLLNSVKVREHPGRSHQTGVGDPAAIIPFAQREMVSLFMEGIDPRFRGQIQRSFVGFLDGLADLLVKKVKAAGASERAVRRQVEKAGEELLAKFWSDIEGYSGKYHVGPVLEAASFLPKDELAGMAETLVSLTSFKRRVTLDPETVGGRIDVAVISKGDGFIWIKRKHYFDPALNRQFFENYYQR
jgi:hypothetical protein